jgi:hypothetical protein
MQLSKHFKDWPLQQYCNGNMLVLFSAFLIFSKKKERFGSYTLDFAEIALLHWHASSPGSSDVLNFEQAHACKASQPACQCQPASPLQRPLLLVLYIHTHTHTQALVLEHCNY